MSPLTVTPGFWLLLAVMWLLDPEVLGWTLPAAAVHELAHFFLLKWMKIRPNGLKLTFFGGELLLPRPLSYRQELPVAAAGPAASLGFALVCVRLGCYLPAGVSLALGLFNLLPIPPLDGGRALGALLALLLPPAQAQAVTCWAGRAAAGVVLVLAAAALWRWDSPALLLPAAWLLIQTWRAPP